MMGSKSNSAPQSKPIAVEEEVQEIVAAWWKPLTDAITSGELAKHGAVQEFLRKV
jgi:hypothetical protein